MSGANPEQLWNLIPNGPTPLTGQEQFLAAQTASPSAPMYRYPTNALSPSGGGIFSSVIATGSTISRTLQNRFADRYSVLDWLTPGQPDGTTDNTTQIQAALNGAAGVAQLLFPATANFYVAKGLVIPSNSHIIIETGATIWLPPSANSSLFIYAPNATGTLVELYGALDGNRLAQTPSSQYSGGILATAGAAGTGGIPAFISNSSVIGNKQGIVRNFLNGGIGFNGATSVEASGISIIGNGNSSGPAGQIVRPESPNFNAGINIVSGTYTGATGIVSVTTNIAHGFVPGQEISPINLTGTGGYTAAGVPGTGNFANNGTYTGTGAIFVALSGTAGTTLRYQANPGGSDGTITAGWFDLWAAPVATILSGTYTSTAASGAPPAGTVVLTTPTPHSLVPGQTALVNVTAGAGTAVTSATGVFVLTAGTQGTTITYDVPFGGTSGSITAGTISLSTKSYKSGFVDCYVDNQNDFGIALYGGCEDSYIRNCEIARTNGGGPSIYSDRNNGRNISCEISGCYVHDTYSSGIVVAVNSAKSLHLNCRIFNNYVTNCVRGAQIENVDGCAIDGNYFYANQVGGVFPITIPNTGDVCILSPADRVTFTNNIIRNAGGGGNNSIAVQVTSGTYNTTTGVVVLTTATGAGVFPGGYMSLTNATGTGAFTSLEGGAIQVTGTTSSPFTCTFLAATGLGTTTITGGQIAPAPFGICLGVPVECLISGNFIGDYQANPTMVAAIGGPWGLSGLSKSNYYGPCINTAGNFPADLSNYQDASQQGTSFDSATGFTSVAIPAYVFAFQSNDFPPTGLTVGFNLSLNNPNVGRGETDFLLGASDGTPGGFDFIKVVAVHLTTGTYTSGAVSLTTNVAHGVAVGAIFTLAAVTGTGTDIKTLIGTWVATSGTAGTTLNFTVAAGLNILTITNGVVNFSTTDGGVIDITAGVGGSLFANDGYGNTRIGGALLHGSLQSGTLSNGGTITVLPNTSFVTVLNGSSIATGTVILPTPSGGESWQTPAGFPGFTNNELEINFENPVGTLTVTAPAGFSVTNAPTAVAAASTSVSFIQVGTAWLRRIMT